MEQDCVAGLYRSLGMSAGAEFSSEDVSVLYGKVFHVPSSTDEAHTAMKTIAGGDRSWSCVGENVFDVLLEMEREREKKERLHWDLQLLNIGNLNTLSVMDKPVIIDPPALACLRQSTDSDTFKKAHSSDAGSLQSCTTDAGRLQTGGNELCGSVRAVRRLKKAARQCWIRLASEGVQSILASPWQGQSLRVKGQAWGFVSLSDVLLLVEVKYDVVTHLLYTEMLQEHHTQSGWETLLPWQRHKEEEGLQGLAEEALESGDMLRLAELPGAFRVYRASLGASFRRCPESREQSWSAVSLLHELHTSRQQERDALTVLGEGMDGESLRLLCLCIRLATLRAQREKLSYSALLAARQTWETWPHVNSPRRAEQAALWLRGDEREQSKDLISLSPQQAKKHTHYSSIISSRTKALAHSQQAVLQLLVLTQEQERKHLVELVHGVSPEDLQGPGCTVPAKEDNRKQTVLRNGCIKRLRQIRASPQTHSEAQTPLEQSNSQPHLQHQPQTQAHICSEPAAWSQRQLEDCSLLLLTHLQELHEVQASTLLPLLMDERAQRLQVLRDEYESELQAQRYGNLLKLLISDGPLTSGSTSNPSVIENSSDEQKTAQSCSRTGPVEAQNVGPGPANVFAVVSARGDQNGVQAADVTGKQDVCTGCGAVTEEMPYLEILCVSDATGKTHQSLTAGGGGGGGGQEEEDVSATKSPQSYEKQGSLITLAWSKPPEDDTDYDTEATDEGAGQSPDGEGCLKTQVQPADIGGTAEYTQREETSGEGHGEGPKPALFQSGSAQSEERQCSTEEQLTSQERTVVDQLEKGEAESECGLQTRALVTEAARPHSDDLCAGPTDETTEVGGDGAEAEICATAAESEMWDLRGPEPTHAEDRKNHSQSTFDSGLPERDTLRESSLTERERVREPVSAMERERTMRNLVDMQKKVEQRQQRDRERQLLRVQERLSIIQNRKAEEDLLGLKHTERLRHLTQDLPLDDRNQQKTVVRERLEQLRRERSYVMQSKRDRNTAGFKELLGPVALNGTETEDGVD